MSVRAPADRPGPFPAARHGRVGTDRTERGAYPPTTRHSDGSGPLVYGTGHLTSRHPDGRVPTLAEAPVGAGGGRRARDRYRLSLSVPLPGAREASVQRSSIDDECVSARSTRRWTDGHSSPGPHRIDVRTPVEVSRRTGKEARPWGGAGADGRGDRATHRLPTKDTP